MLHTTGFAKKVKTFDLTGKENGYLVELKTSGRRTKSYLTVAYPKCFKGYHAHLVRESNYVCIRGQVRVIMISPVGRHDVILDASGENSYQKLHIPINTPTAISNECDEEAWLINHPTPAYDPVLKDEQIDLTEEQAYEWVKNIK